MASVKQSLVAVSALLSPFLAQACSTSDLARFAPPGVVKYEDIASKKEPNPAIQERIRERKEGDDVRFPVLSQTPGASDRPQRPIAEDIEAASATLTTARDDLAETVANDRALADADRVELDNVTQGRDDLAEAA